MNTQGNSMKIPRIRFLPNLNWEIEMCYEKFSMLAFINDMISKLSSVTDKVLDRSQGLWDRRWREIIPEKS